jgi:hypothetical protein
MNYNKLIQGILGATLTASTLFPNLVEAKPAFGERIDNTIKSANQKRKAGERNFKEWRKDVNLWEAKKCQLTQSNTERCQNLIKKARNQK